MTICIEVEIPTKNGMCVFCEGKKGKVVFGSRYKEVNGLENV